MTRGLIWSLPHDHVQPHRETGHGESLQRHRRAALMAPSCSSFLPAISDFCCSVCPWAKKLASPPASSSSHLPLPRACFCSPLHPPPPSGTAADPSSQAAGGAARLPEGSGGAGRGAEPTGPAAARVSAGELTRTRPWAQLPRAGARRRVPPRAGYGAGVADPAGPAAVCSCAQRTSMCPFHTPLLAGSCPC